MSVRLVDGNTKVTWVTTLSSTTSPTATQLNAGVDLQAFITSDGLEITPDQNMIDMSVLSSVSEFQDFGRTKVDGSVTARRESTDTAWTTFASQPSGYLVIRRGSSASATYAASQKVEVYPMKASKRLPVKPAANEVEKFTVKLALIGDYSEEATVA